MKVRDGSPASPRAAPKPRPPARPDDAAQEPADRYSGVRRHTAPALSQAMALPTTLAPSTTRPPFMTQRSAPPQPPSQPRPHLSLQEAFGLGAAQAWLRPEVQQAAQAWGKSQQGPNQLIMHVQGKDITRLEAIERQRGLPSGRLSETKVRPADADVAAVALLAMHQEAERVLRQPALWFYEERRDGQALHAWRDGLRVIASRPHGSRQLLLQTLMDTPEDRFLRLQRRAQEAL